MGKYLLKLVGKYNIKYLTRASVYTVHVTMHKEKPKFKQLRVKNSRFYAVKASSQIKRSERTN